LVQRRRRASTCRLRTNLTPSLRCSSRLPAERTQTRFMDRAIFVRVASSQPQKKARRRMSPRSRTERVRRLRLPRAPTSEVSVGFNDGADPSVATGRGRPVAMLRLQALQDAPYAFGTTYAEASQWTADRWEAQVIEFATFVAVLDG